jgi:hypothetical protein
MSEAGIVGRGGGFAEHGKPPGRILFEAAACLVIELSREPCAERLCDVRPTPARVPAEEQQQRGGSNAFVPLDRGDDGVSERIESGVRALESGHVVILQL